MKRVALLITFVILSNITIAQWVQTNGPNGGYITSLTISGNNIFAGTHGGIYSSTDYGSNWAAVNNGLSDWEVNTLISNEDYIFAGTGGAAWTPVPGGVFRSTNNGTSWTFVFGPPGNPGILSLAIKGTYVFAGNIDALFRSTDNGLNWAQVNTVGFSRAYALTVKGDNIFAGTAVGIYISTDNGSSWSPVNNGLPTNPFAYTFTISGDNIFASIFGGGVYISSDNGSSWSQVNNGLSDTFVYALSSYGINIYAGTLTGIFLSTDNGSNWNLISNGLPINQVIYALASQENNIFAGTLGAGVFFSSNNGSNWAPVNNGLNNTVVTSLAEKNGNLFAGTDVLGMYFSTDDGINWNSVNNDLPANTYIKSVSIKDNNIFVGTNSGIYVSTNDGISWNQLSSELTDVNSFTFSGDYILAGRVSGSGSGIYVSNDNGLSWDQTFYYYVYDLKAKPNDTGGFDIYAASSQGVLHSIDNGFTWTTILDPLPNYGFYFSAIDINGDDIYVGTGGGGNGGGGGLIFRSTNNGLDWTQVTNGLPMINAINDFAVYNNNIFVLTFGFGIAGGVYLSSNNGLNWYAVSDGLPLYNWMNYPSSTVSGSNIYVGTSGSGVWRRPLSEMIEENAYVLKRTVNGTTETYSLNNHAWSFQNNPDNMWPQTWWEQFDYSQPQYPIAWADFSAERFPDWPLFATAFGESQCYWNPPPGIIIYKYFATKYWINISNQEFNPNTNEWDYWGGSCFGFAISSFLFFDQMLSLESVFPGNQTLFNVPLLDDSRKLVNLYWTYVTGEEHRSYLNQNYKKSPVQTLIEIKNMFIDTLRDDRVMYFNHQNGSGAHAVNPYRVGVGQSIDTIYIYDNNAPDKERKIYVNKIDSTWDYPDMPGWGGSKGLFLMEPASNYLTNPILPNQLPPKERYISNKLVDNNFIEIYNSFNSDIAIKNANGDSIGFKISDGKIYFNFQDGMPIIPVTGNEHPPIGYYIPNDNYHLELSNVQDTSVYVSFFNDSLAFSINRNSSTQNDVENFNFESSNHKLEILNSDYKTKIYDIGVIIAGEESEKVLEVNNLEMLWNDSLKFYPEPNENLKVENFGVGKSYNLNVKLASASGESIFEHSNISLTANSAHTIIPTWQNLDSVTIYVDNGNDGTIDDSINVGNQFTGFNDEEGSIPTEFNLFQNYPNPFNSSSIIKYSIPKFSQVTIKIFNTLGEELETLINEEKPTGTYEIEFNAANHSSGVYFYRLQAGSYVESKKMILLK